MRNALRLFRLELGRLLCGRPTLLVMLLTVLSPALGLTFYRPLYSTSQAGYATTTLGVHLANPALAGGLAGAVLFALLTVAELDRAQRSGIDVLTDAIVSPLTAAPIRLFSLLSAAALTQAVTMLAWLPYTAYAAGAVFDGGAYVLSYLLFMFLALPIAILFAASAYQFTRRFDLSAVLFAAFAGLSLTVWSQNWQLCWLNPCVWAISDDFSNFRLFRSVAYVRLTWLLALAGLYTLSYLCIRRYGKGLLGSLARSARRVYRPALALALLCCAAAAYIHQPFIDHSKELIDGSYFDVDALEGVTCSSRYADVHPDPKTGRLYGKASYQIQNNTGHSQDVRFATKPGYRITSVRANGVDVPFSMDTEEEQNAVRFTVTLPDAPEIDLQIGYGGFPRDWNIVSTMQGEPEISADYMKLENYVLAPAPYDFFYRDGTLPAVMDLTLPGRMTPILFGDGKTALHRENGDGSKTWRMEDNGYTMIVYAGDYVREDIEAAGLTVHFYYGRKHQPVMEAAGAKEAVRQVIEYCTAHYGPLSAYADGSFNLIQSRVAGGGYAGGGASTLDEIDFTAENLANAGKGAAPAEVMIHELVHQWWGLGNMFDSYRSDGSTAWSSEGLTVYTTYRIVKELYGEEAARQNYVDQWRANVDGYYKDFYVRHPEYLDALPSKFQADIANSLSGMRHYNEMPLKILKAEQLVGGEAAMDRILYGLFNREIDSSYPYLTYQEFLDACGLTEEDLRLD